MDLAEHLYNISASAKTEIIDIILIHINSEIYPRTKVDEQLVESYRVSMEAGVKFPPLVVQKDTHTLIDGLHRYHALKKLETKKVEVEILDIPDTELRAETVRRNVRHGKRLTTMELRLIIAKLRFTDKKSLKEIAEIVGMTEGRVSQICKEFRYSERSFNNFNPKVPKIDMRVKVNMHDEEEILNDLKAGLSGKEVAEKHGVSQPTVSRIKKEHEAWTSSPVYIKMGLAKAKNMFKVAFMNKLLKKARFEFKEKGVIIRNSEGKKPPFLVAIFKSKYFWEYNVKQPFEGYAESDILTQLKTCDPGYIGNIELALSDSKTWKIRWEDHKKSHTYDSLDWREFPIPHLELDENGIPPNIVAKAELFQSVFPIKQKGDLTLKMENGELTCSFKCHNDWLCNQKLKPKLLEKNDDARAIVDLQTLDEALKIFMGPVWIGMWSDQTHIAIGQGGANSKMCFII